MRRVSRSKVSLRLEIKPLAEAGSNKLVNLRGIMSEFKEALGVETVTIKQACGVIPQYVTQC